MNQSSARPLRRAQAVELFRIARAWAEDHHPDELERIRRLGPHVFEGMPVDEFLRKYIWVVYASGFKEKVLRSLFPRLRAAFQDFDIGSIAAMESVDAILEVFGNRRKAECVVRGARQIQEETYEAFKAKILENGTDELQKLPGIGPITKKHLARNLGLEDIAKDDVWMVRLANLLGGNVCDCAGFLSREFDEGPGTVDVILWRFCVDEAWKDFEHTTLEGFLAGLAR